MLFSMIRSLAGTSTDSRPGFDPAATGIEAPAGSNQPAFLPTESGEERTTGGEVTVT